MKDKEVIRQQILALRNGLSEEDRLEFSRAIGERFFHLPMVRDAARLMLFLSFGSEVDTWLLLEQAIAMGKSVVAPICLPATKELALYPISDGKEAVPGHWGILEPPRAGEAISPDTLDVVVVPGIAFDGAGQRVGYGGGYYDRFLPRADRAWKIGVCYDLQLVDSLPYAPHDVPVDVIVTERQAKWREMSAGGMCQD